MTAREELAHYVGGIVPSCSDHDRERIAAAALDRADGDVTGARGLILSVILDRIDAALPRPWQGSGL